jgi:hypothetical protein
MHRIEIAGGIEGRVHLDPVYLRAAEFAALQKALRAGRDELGERLHAHREQFAATDDAKQLGVLQSRRGEFQAEAQKVKEKLLAAEQELGKCFKEGKDPSSSEEKAAKLRGRLNTLLSWADKAGREIAALTSRLEESFAASWRAERRRYSAECQASLAQFNDALTKFLAERAPALARVQSGYEILYETESRALPKAVA